MKKIGVSIIGCGSIYKNHAQAIMNSDYCELVSVVDIDETKAKEAAALYQCRYYTDYKDMLKDESIGMIHICTPHYLHAPMAIDAMKAGKDVLVEKPLALNVCEAQNVIEVAAQTGRHLTVCFQNRYNPTSLKIMEIIKSQTLGAVKGVKGIVTWARDEHYYLDSNWRGKWATEGGGVLINQSIHTLDLLQWFGGNVTEVKGHVDTRVLKNVIEVEDTADATLFFENGARGIFYATNCFTTNSSVEVEIHFEYGILKLVDGVLLLNGDIILEDVNSISGEKSYWGLGHQDLIHDFHKAVSQHETVGYVTAQEAIKSLEIIEAIYKSSKNR